MKNSEKVINQILPHWRKMKKIMDKHPGIFNIFYMKDGGYSLLPDVQQLDYPNGIPEHLIMPDDSVLAED